MAAGNSLVEQGEELKLDEQRTGRVLGMGKEEGCEVIWPELLSTHEHSRRGGAENRSWDLGWACWQRILFNSSPDMKTWWACCGFLMPSFPLPTAVWPSPVPLPGK